jgi:hypothetical protein
MAYKVGTTIVIDDSGFVDWSRIANKPAIGAGDITAVTVANGNPSTGSPFTAVSGSGGGNCNCTANCYVASLSGGGTSGDVSVSANRAYFNCNCACRC